MSTLTAETRDLQTRLMRAARYAKRNPGDPGAARDVEVIREEFRLASAIDTIVAKIEALNLTKSARERIAAAILTADLS